MARKKIINGSRQALQKAGLGARILQIRRIFFNDNNRRFAEEIGENEKTLSQICSGNRNGGQAVVKKILCAMPQINGNWLMTGMGEMITTSKEENKVVCLKKEQDRMSLLKMFLRRFPDSNNINDEKRYLEYVIACVEDGVYIDDDEIKKNVSEDKHKEYVHAYSWIKLTYEYLVDNLQTNDVEAGEIIQDAQYAISFFEKQIAVKDSRIEELVRENERIRLELDALKEQAAKYAEEKGVYSGTTTQVES